VTAPVDGSLDPQGPGARVIAELWWLLLALGVAVFVVFAVLLALGLFRRGRAAGQEPGGPAPPRFGGWFVGAGVVAPLLILVVVFAATVAAMRALPSGAAPEALEVEIVGHQFWWEVRYPERGVTVRDELHLPVGRPVRLRLTSADVIHSFWVPALAGKLDLLPDTVNTLELRADEPGRHLSICAEFCGLRHADMRMVVVAEPADQFAAWLAGRRERGP
jgi:cytochrome c oxidase subunit II